MKKIHFVSLGLFIVLLGLWEWASYYMSQLVLPAPSVVFPLLWSDLTSGYFNAHVFQTTTEVLGGLLIGSLFGITMGVLMGEVKWLGQMLSPYVIASQAIPKLALAPLFVLWFGFGTSSKVVITALICFFPLLESTMTAIRHTNKDKQNLFKVLQASRWQTLIHLKIPEGLPVIMSGFRVAVVLALVGAVVGEFIGANQGLGALIIASQGMMDTPLMFAVLILLTVLGMLLYGLVNLIEVTLLKKYFYQGER
ncbi:ABC transporter permease [Oceanisphaera pacifica]|uniref:ABC transporter permease n=1 Tax=Oceanisphaera pacifica TaxID=2818389 RepID=A0ABS3NIF9_9GAMM|nr:ABC transporter permease [Oceanisphaera pacifica]MBO1520376.1 ABC transporter permease [Oceanisphaera pacifica]